MAKNRLVMIFGGGDNLSVTRADGKALTHDDIWNQLRLIGFDMDNDEMFFKKYDDYVEVYINNRFVCVMSEDVFNLV